MPLTPKGRKIKRKMRQTYGAKKGAQVFHASANKGTITGVEQKSMKHRAAMRHMTGY